MFPDTVFGAKSFGLINKGSIVGSQDALDNRAFVLGAQVERQFDVQMCV